MIDDAGEPRSPDTLAAIDAEVERLKPLILALLFDYGPDGLPLESVQKGLGYRDLAYLIVAASHLALERPPLVEMVNDCLYSWRITDAGVAELTRRALP